MPCLDFLVRASKLASLDDLIFWKTLCKAQWNCGLCSGGVLGCGERPSTANYLVSWYSYQSPHETLLARDHPPSEGQSATMTWRITIRLLGI